MLYLKYADYFIVFEKNNVKPIFYLGLT